MKYYTSGGLAPMGYAMPTAIGCAFASPEKRIFAICGDGAFHMSTQSLGVIAQQKLPVKVIIMNNNCLGMINQFQRLYFESRFYGTHPTYGFQNPSYEDIAKAYGIQYYKINEKDLSNKELMQRIFSCKTCVIEYVIEGFTSVCPKLEYDKPLSKPMPMLDEDEFNRAFSIFN
jgi:acetolactate synthase-1/2/3 large subunit